MGSQFNISNELERLRIDYTAVTGEAPFNHFYCPILLEDVAVELCAGHIINEGIPNSSRKCVVQRKDVDSFYGSIAESDYLTALRASGKSIHDFLEDESLRGKLRPELKVDGEIVPYYEVRGKVSKKHALLQLEKVNGVVLPLALKVSPDELPDSAHVQLVVDRDFTAHAVASLLKAAHLTMFSVMGYRYIFSPSGLDMARILGNFYRANPNRTGHDRAEAVREYFSPLAGMMMPVRGFNCDFVKGSIEDGRFMTCVGTSNKFYSLGVSPAYK